jgi:hypothetical protein
MPAIAVARNLRSVSASGVCGAGMTFTSVRSSRRRGSASCPTWQSSQAVTAATKSSLTEMRFLAMTVIRPSIAANVAPIPMAMWIRSP